MTKILNIDTDVYNQFTDFVLEGTAYKLHVYLTTQDRWYISFYDPDLFDNNDLESGLLLGGIRVMPDPVQDILKIKSEDPLPEGLLTTIDTNPNSQNPDEEPRITPDNFGRSKRFQLVYFTETEKLNLFKELEE